MRLIEVDEAANHILELVDPDANIIWGSAFNDNLNGKIRVSVVATGIDSEVDVSAPRSQASTFPTRTVTAQPVAAPATAPVAERASSGTAQAPEAAHGFPASSHLTAAAPAPASAAAVEQENHLHHHASSTPATATSPSPPPSPVPHSHT